MSRDKTVLSITSW